jgi:hypothetical protein
MFPIIGVAMSDDVGDNFFQGELEIARNLVGQTVAPAEIRQGLMEPVQL